MTDTVDHVGPGPYETERQAADAARHIYDSDPGTGAWGDGNLRLLEDACRAAGVQLGAYDTRILVWLTGWEPTTCAVIAGLISRPRADQVAAEAVVFPEGPRQTMLAALADAAAYRTAGADARCEDCMAHPAGCCDPHADDLEQASAYRELAREIGGQR
jgi:hypothetical protein